VGILYGQWRPGATVRVRPDGVVGAASPDIAAALTGSRLFTLPAADAAQLLDLLADADAPVETQEAFRRENPTEGPPPPTFAQPLPSAPPPVAPLTPGGPPDGPGSADAAAAEPAEPTPPLPPAALPESATPTAPEGPGTSLELTLFGTVRLAYRTPDGGAQTVAGIGIKGREILAYLAAYRDGATRDTLIDAIWPEDGRPRQRIDNRFYAALSPLRRKLTAATSGQIDQVVDHDDNRWWLRPDLLTVDLWQVQDALDAHRHATTPTAKLAALLPLTTLYTGHLAEDLSSGWIEPHRENLRRNVTDALARLASSIGHDNPRRVDLLTTLRRLDPYDEQIYLEIARTQARLGQHDAVTATYQQLVTALADLGEHPTPTIVHAFQALTQPRTQDERSA
jgi:DNA-binding SARP family transcriptional activator